MMSVDRADDGFIVVSNGYEHITLTDDDAAEVARRLGRFVLGVEDD